MVSGEDCGLKNTPIELFGLSTDTKPTGTYHGDPIVNASTFFEMDTGNLYWYDEDSSSWVTGGGSDNG